MTVDPRSSAGPSEPSDVDGPFEARVPVWGTRVQEDGTTVADEGMLVVARAPGRAPFLRYFSPGSHEELELRLAPGGHSVRGVVVDRTGRSRPGVRLGLTVALETRTSGLLAGEQIAPVEEVRGGLLFIETVSDDVGRYRVDGLPAGAEVVVGVRAGQRLSGRADDRASGETGEVQLLGALELHVVSNELRGETSVAADITDVGDVVCRPR